MIVVKTWDRKKRFCVLALMPVYFIVVAFLIQSPGEILAGLTAIIMEPDLDRKSVV